MRSAAGVGEGAVFLATTLHYYSPTFLRLTATILHGPGTADDEGLLTLGPRGALD